MIPIKEHNDIVQKLMKQITSRDQQLKSAIREKTKLPPQAPQLQPTKNEELLNKKIAQLTKEHKERVGSLNQQIKNQQLQIKELKERLVIKTNIETKEKEHIAQILKKTYDRKPSSGADYKISALITHYQGEIDKKSKFIETLQKRMRELESSSSLRETTFETSSNENFKTVVKESEQTKGISITDHNRQLNKVRVDSQKFKKLFQEKDKEYRDLARRYSQLTNQYYKIINSYGIQEQIPKTRGIQVIRSEQEIKGTPKITKKNNALDNLLHEMVCSESEPQEMIVNKRTFSSKVARLQAKGTFLKQENLQDQVFEIQQKPSFSPETQDYPENSAASMKLEQIMEHLSVQDPNDIVPLLIKIKTNMQEYNLVDTIARSLQVFFCNIGKGKLTKKQLISSLQDLQGSYTKTLQAVDTLDEICIEAGAKRQKLKQKIQQLIKTSQQYYQKLKSIKFMQEVAKGSKIIQFIQFFDLDKEQMKLPQQLLKIQEQLKSIDKFIRQTRAILEISGESSSQEVLQLVLRYLQKTTALVSQLQKKKSKGRSKEEKQ